MRARCVHYNIRIQYNCRMNSSREVYVSVEAWLYGYYMMLGPVRDQVPSYPNTLRSNNMSRYKRYKAEESAGEHVQVTTQSRHGHVMNVVACSFTVFKQHQPQASTGYLKAVRGGAALMDRPAALDHPGRPRTYRCRDPDNRTPFVEGPMGIVTA